MDKLTLAWAGDMPAGVCYRLLGTVSLFLRKPQEALPWGMTKDGCSPECSGSHLMTMRGTSLSMELTLWLADGRGGKKWV